MPFNARNLGPLPVEIINRALGTELEPGQARLSAKAHKHMAEKHPSDYPICITLLAAAIQAPTFIGQAPGHADNFEMIKRAQLADGRMVLVAAEPDSRGDYRVRSCYLIEGDKVETRRRNGRLKLVRPK